MHECVIVELTINWYLCIPFKGIFGKDVKLISQCNITIILCLIFISFYVYGLKWNIKKKKWGIMLLCIYSAIYCCLLSDTSTNVEVKSYDAEIFWS